MFEGDWTHPGSPPSGEDQAGGHEFDHSDLGKGVLRPFPSILCHSWSLQSEIFIHNKFISKALAHFNFRNFIQSCV